MGESQTLHASCVLIGESAILVRGAPGTGKSSLCAALIAAAAAAGRFARLVSDDRTRVEARHGRLLARAVAATAGLMETRGIGVHSEPHEPTALIRLVVDLVNDEPPRMPEEAEATTTLCGVSVPRLQARQGPLSAHMVLRRLRLNQSPIHDTFS